MGWLRLSSIDHINILGSTVALDSKNGNFGRNLAPFSCGQGMIKRSDVSPEEGKNWSDLIRP